MAKQVALIARQFNDENDLFAAAETVQQQLFSYADTIEAWAGDVSDIMLKRADQADYDTWLKVGKEMSAATRRRLKSAAIGLTHRRLQDEQVTLIKSLPLDAAKKVHEWATEGMTKGMRYPDIAKRIREELGAVTETRAICIARTETARARTNFTQARAQAVGSTGYIWRTVGDGAVRPMHAALDGTVQRWDAPPVCERGRGGEPIRAAPGCVWNCRCYAEPIFSKSEYDK